MNAVVPSASSRGASERNPRWRLVPLLRRAGFAWIAVALALSAAPVVAQPAPDDVTPAGGGKILLGRSIPLADGTLRSSSLFRVNADGSRLQQLTRRTNSVLHGSPSWSPGGGRLAYTRVVNGKSDIHVMDSQGLGSRQVTTGPQNFLMPAWGPRGMIAFVTRSFYDPVAGTTRDCVSIMGADGSGQRSIFCPPVESSTGNSMQQPVWSADGNFISFEINLGLAFESWYSTLYRVDVRTNAASLLFDTLALVEPQRPDVSFARDGTHALLGDAARGVLRLDFTSGGLTVLAPGGYAPLYSDDNRKIAFTRSVNDGGRNYGQLFVMDADGGNVRPLTATQVDGVSYHAADWSRDGTRLLVNRTIFVDATTPPRVALRLIDVQRNTISPVTPGYTYRGSWFEPRLQASRASGY